MLAEVWHFISYVEEQLRSESIDFPARNHAGELKSLQGIARELFPREGCSLYCSPTGLGHPALSIFYVQCATAAIR